MILQRAAVYPVSVCAEAARGEPLAQQFLRTAITLDRRMSKESCKKLRLCQAALPSY